MLTDLIVLAAVFALGFHLGGKHSTYKALGAWVRNKFDKWLS